MNDHDYGYGYVKSKAIDVTPPSDVFTVRIGNRTHQLTRAEAHSLRVELTKAGA